MINSPSPISQYTTRVKHASRWSLILTILVAAIIAFQVVKQQQRTRHITQLLNSPAITDRLEGIALLQHTSFDTLRVVLASTASEENEVAIAAQKLLVKRALKESKVDALSTLQIDDDLYAAAIWWDTHRTKQKTTPQTTPEPKPQTKPEPKPQPTPQTTPEPKPQTTPEPKPQPKPQTKPQTKHEGAPVTDQQFQLLASNSEASPWIRRLAALHCTQVIPSIDDLIYMPLRDRDGSVTLAVLAIDRHVPKQEVVLLIESWAKDYDIERKKASVLLASLANVAIPTIQTHDLTLSTLITICSQKHSALAWRSMHKSNGMIDPDIMLASLIIDSKRFLPVLIETTKTKLWVHPEHPVELARHFASSITEVIPEELLDHDSTRNKWWDIFACGLLFEER